MRRVALAAWLLGAVLAGCGADGTGRWLDAVAAAHRLADEALARGDLDGARAAVLEIVRSEAPGGLSPADARAVLANARCRLAELALRAGRAAEALAEADRGLALGPGGGDVFEANLHIARGRALEALARPAEAAEAYHRALLVHEALLRAAAGGAP